MKRWNGLRRAIYRGINRVRWQVILTVLAVNMKRLLAISAQSTVVLSGNARLVVLVVI
ncbi:hypothetical protein DRQ36_09380 [bacterium]|nr:MAG: hypothetical protein DRQ36_09380 [bacterium]